MAKLRPHTSTVIISIVCILVVLGTTIYVYRPSTDSNLATQDLITTPTSLDQVATVSNNDWQKAFFGGGTNSNTKNGTASTQSSSPEKLTDTDLMGRDFFVAYAQLHQSGMDTNQQSVDAAAKQVITNYVARMPSPTLYTKDAITTTKADDTKTLQAYARSVKLTLQSDMPSQNEAVIIAQAYDANDLSLLKKIDPIIAGYKKTIKDLLGTTVPISMASYHVSLINGISRALYNAEALRNTDTDPARSVVAINQEVPALQAISDAISNIQAYLTARGVNL